MRSLEIFFLSSLGEFFCFKTYFPSEVCCGLIVGLKIVVKTVPEVKEDREKNSTKTNPAPRMKTRQRHSVNFLRKSEEEIELKFHKHVMLSSTHMAGKEFEINNNNKIFYIMLS